MCNECVNLRQRLLDKTYLWKREELQLMKGKELDEICGTLRLKKNGLRKEQKIEKILFALSDEGKEMIEKKVRDLVEQPCSDVAPLHDFYRHNFNAVDKGNQVKHSMTIPGRWHNETARMIHGIMKLAFTNLFCIMYYNKKWIDEMNI